MKLTHQNIIKLLKTTNCQQPQSTIMQLGRSFMKLIFKKITFIDIGDKKIFQQYQSKIPQIIFQSINQQINYSTKQRLLMCFGIAFRDKKFEDLDKYEEQISNIINNTIKQKSFTKWNQTSSTASILDISSILDKSQTLQSIPIKSQKNINKNNFEKNKQLKKELFCQKKPTSNFFINDDNNQNDLSSFDTSWIEYPQQTKVRKYLQQILNYCTQLTHFFQIMKIEVKWQPREEISVGYRQKVISRISNVYTNYKQKKFQGIGQGKNCKDARNKASKQFLQKLYIQIPAIWKQFASIKLKRGLKT